MPSLLVVEGKGAASYTNGGGGQTTGGWRRCCGRPEPKGTIGVESTSYTRDRTKQGRTRVSRQALDGMRSKSAPWTRVGELARGALRFPRLVWRSDERRVGKECGSTSRSRWSRC